MKRSTDRILTTHVGSLVRTPDIVECQIRKHLGEAVDNDDYANALRDGVRDVVHRQARIGVDVIDDGEYGKLNWITYLGERVQGFEKIEVDPNSVDGAGSWPEQDRFGEFYRAYVRYETKQWLPITQSFERYTDSHVVDYRNLVCRSKLEYDPAPLRRDIANFKAALGEADVTECFMPVVAPASFEMVPNEYYETPDDYLDALAQVLNEEYRMIVDAGFILQVDDAALPAMQYFAFRDQPFDTYLAWAERRVEAVNQALEGIPEDRVRYHICFGSQNMPHTTDPALRDVVGLLFKVRAQGYAIEACNPRHEHECEIWKDVSLPDGKILIPGVIGHATNIVEHPRLIAQRLKRFANLVGKENIMAGSDCGFSQGWNSPRVHSQVQWAKLEALVEGAQIASAALWQK